MRIVRTVVAVLAGMLAVVGSIAVSMAASHQPAPQEKKAEEPAAMKTRRHVGTVKAVDPAAGMLTVAEKGGDAEVTVGDKTSIMKGKESLKLSDLQPGDEVTVVYMKEGGKDIARSVRVKGK